MSPTFPPPADTSTEDSLVPDDLYQRYQAAHRAHRAHATTCSRCTDTIRCPDGERLFEAFTRLQDAYLARQRRQQRP